MKSGTQIHSLYYFFTFSYLFDMLNTQLVLLA